MEETKFILRVELIIRLKENQELPVWINEEFAAQYSQFRDGNKHVFSVPCDWEGFRDGKASDLVRSDLDVYISLALFTNNDAHVILDLHGNLIKGFSTVYGETPYKKYLKKSLCVVEVLNKERPTVGLHAYSLNLQYSTPVINSLSAKVDGDEGLGAMMSAFEYVYGKMVSGDKR